MRWLFTDIIFNWYVIQIFESEYINRCLVINFRNWGLRSSSNNIRMPQKHPSNLFTINSITSMNYKKKNQHSQPPNSQIPIIHNQTPNRYQCLHSISAWNSTLKTKISKRISNFWPNKLRKKQHKVKIIWNYWSKKTKRYLIGKRVILIPLKISLKSNNK